MLTNPLSHSSYNNLFIDTPQYSFNAKDGTSKRIVCKIVEDPGGKLWLITPNGLSRYDSRGVKNYRHNPLRPESISSDQVSCVFCDSKGILWVGCPNGLNKYNPVTDTFSLFKNDPNDSNSLSDNCIRILIEDKAGNLWIGTANGLNLLKSRDEKMTITRFMFSEKHDKNLSVVIYDLYADSVGMIWAATSDGLAKIHDYGTRVEMFRSDLPTQEKKQIILLAGNNKELKSVFRETFEDKFQIIQPADGGEVLDKIIDYMSEATITIVVTNDPNGMTLCRKIKTDARTRHLPVVLLTSKATSENETEKILTDFTRTKPMPLYIQLSELDIRDIPDSDQRVQKLLDWQSLIDYNMDFDNSDITFIRNLTQIIEAHISDRNFNVPKLTTLIGMSQSVLYKKLRGVYDTTVNGFIKSIRLNKAAELLRQQKLSVHEISLMVGFEDRKYFSREFKKQFGLSPKNWIKI